MNRFRIKKNLLILVFIKLFLFSGSMYSQHRKLIQFETNKILCILNFLETSAGNRGTSISFKKYINEHIEKETLFRKIIERYENINFNYQFLKEEYPIRRHSYTDIKDLIWIASSNSKSIDDFSNRIIGYLPHKSHYQLIDIFKKIEPYYDQLIWNNYQEHIKETENKLNTYRNQIQDLFTQIDTFYGTGWNKEIPFRVLLYPIPLEKGQTTAIPMGNILICSYLALNKEDYKQRLGVIIHEMCHILYKEQPIKKQEQIDHWFTSSKDKNSNFTYSFINEGLATAIGNGWSYYKIHKSENKKKWYRNSYINTYAQGLCPLVSNYLDNNIAIDQEFVTNAINIFNKEFPKADSDINILFNELNIYINTEDTLKIDHFVKELNTKFSIHSSWLFTPIMNDEVTKTFLEYQRTKLFILSDDQNKDLIKLLKKIYNLKNLNFPEEKNFIYSFTHNKSHSLITIINLTTPDHFTSSLSKLKEMKYLTNKIEYH